MTPHTTDRRKPRIALMGEFSAGKSTLANLLLEQNTSPVQATATQLPPVWYSLGAPGAERRRRDGAREPIPIDEWAESGMDGTRTISVNLEADFLETADLIDMPGTSDPNMEEAYWEEVLPQVDLVIWCTPANQAWRQSEAALWESMPPALWARSLLLVTRIDQVPEDIDRRRILARVRKEAGAQFAKVLPIALPQAFAGREDREVQIASGAAAMMEYLEAALAEIMAASDPAQLRTDPAAPSPQTVEAMATDGAAPAVKIVPRRVTPRRRTRRRTEAQPAALSLG